MDNYRLIEALLYVHGDKGLTPHDLKTVIDVAVPEARKEIKRFAKSFNKENRGIQVLEFHDAFKFATRDEFLSDIKKLAIENQVNKLSNAATEVVAIVAYKQPITRSQINEIRGIASEAVVNTLLVKELIKEVGIASTPGNPIQYGLTQKFYDYFRIKSLTELPTLDQFQNYETEDEDFKLFESQRED